MVPKLLRCRPLTEQKVADSSGQCMLSATETSNLNLAEFTLSQRPKCRVSALNTVLEFGNLIWRGGRQRV